MIAVLVDGTFQAQIKTKVRPPRGPVRRGSLLEVRGDQGAAGPGPGRRGETPGSPGPGPEARARAPASSSPVHRGSHAAVVGRLSRCQRAAGARTGLLHAARACGVGPLDMGARLRHREGRSSTPAAWHRSASGWLLAAPPLGPPAPPHPPPFPPARPPRRPTAQRTPSAPLPPPPPPRPHPSPPHLRMTSGKIGSHGARKARTGDAPAPRMLCQP